MYLYNKKTNNTGGMLWWWAHDDADAVELANSKKKCKLDRAILIKVYTLIYTYWKQYLRILGFVF